MSILKQLFDGDYYPSEQVVPQSDEYKSKRTACNIALTELEQALGSEDDPALTRFLDIYAEVIDLINFEFFKEGIRFGIALTRELENINEEELDE